MINLSIARPNLIPSAWTDMANQYLGVVAGGAVRDTFLGHTPKDVDIFTWMDLWGKDLPKGARRKDDDWEYDREHIKRVWTFEQDGVEYDIVVLEQRYVKNINELIDTFYADICQFWADPKGKIMLAQKAVQAIETRTITFKHDRHVDLDDPEAHLVKKMQKFVDEGFVLLNEPDPFKIDEWNDDIPF